MFEKIDAAKIKERETGYDGAIELYLLRCRSKNLSPDSIKICQKCFKGFIPFLASLNCLSPKDTDSNHIRAYLAHLRESKRANSTIVRFYGVLHSFFKFLKAETMVIQNPMDSVEKPRTEKRLIKPMSAEQIQILLAQPNTRIFTGLRNYAMLVTLLDTGLRLSELLTLKASQISWAQNCFTVFGKGAKERTVPFGANAKKVLWDYFQRRGNVEGQDTFFIDQFGQPIKMRWIQHIVRRYGEKAGIKGVRISPHTLRHTFATQYILNGGDAFSLQQILGHSTLDMVRIYVGLANRDVALQHQKFSPIDRLGVLPNQRKQVVLK